MAQGGPAFSAYGGAQSIANATFVKVAINAKEFDTDNAFDATTNYRFQPAVAGYYQINAQVMLAGSAAQLLAAIYKNGTEFKHGTQSGSAASSAQGAVVNALVYLNGSTDYLELWTYQNSGGAVNTYSGPIYTYFQGVLVRSA